MRIGDQGYIRISFKPGTLNAISRMQPGTEVGARIVERYRGNVALLDIAGTRVNAEFIRGTPRADRLLLRLEHRHGGRLVFRMLNTIDKSSFLDRILACSVFRPDDFSRQHTYEISRFLGGRTATLFALNEFLLGLASRWHKRDSSSDTLFRALMKMGRGRDSVNLISFLSLESRAGSAMLPLLLMLGYGRGFIDKWNSGRQEWIGEEVDRLVRDISEIAGEDEKRELVTGILRECLQEETGDDDYHSGTLPFVDGDEYAPVCYIGKGDCWIFSLTLSNLGPIDILSKNTGKGTEITVYTDGPKVSSYLQESMDEFYSGLAGAGISAIVHVADRQNVIDKILEINSYYSLNSAFDTKV